MSFPFACHWSKQVTHITKPDINMVVKSDPSTGRGSGALYNNTVHPALSSIPSISVTVHVIVGPVHHL